MHQNLLLICLDGYAKPFGTVWRVKEASIGHTVAQPTKSAYKNCPGFVLLGMVNVLIS